jgi:hypothetical protein
VTDLPSKGRLALAAILLIPILLVAIGGYPFLHNHYIHPLGRLSRKISIGESCDSVAEKFSQYVSSRAVSPQVDYSDHILTSDLYHTQDVPPSRGLSLYDLSPFDDLQIRVRCSASGSVVEKLVILD